MCLLCRSLVFAEIIRGKLATTMEANNGDNKKNERRRRATSLADRLRSAIRVFTCSYFSICMGTGNGLPSLFFVDSQHRHRFKLTMDYASPGSRTAIRRTCDIFCEYICIFTVYFDDYPALYFVSLDPSPYHSTSERVDVPWNVSDGINVLSFSKMLSL